MKYTKMRDYVLHELSMNVRYELGYVQDKKYVPITATVTQNNGIAPLVASFPNIVYDMYLALAEHHCGNYDDKEFVWYYLRMKVSGQDESFAWLDADSISVTPVSFDTMNNALSGMYETLVQWGVEANKATGKYATYLDALVDQMRMQRDLMKHCINDRALHIVDYDDFAQDQLPKKIVQDFITQLAMSVASKQMSADGRGSSNSAKTLNRKARKIQNKGSEAGGLYYDHQYYDNLTSSNARDQKTDSVSDYCPYDIYDL